MLIQVSKMTGVRADGSEDTDLVRNRSVGGKERREHFRNKGSGQTRAGNELSQNSQADFTVTRQLDMQYRAEPSRDGWLETHIPATDANDQYLAGGWCQFHNLGKREPKPEQSNGKQKQMGLQ